MKELHKNWNLLISRFVKLSMVLIMFSDNSLYFNSGKLKDDLELFGTVISNGLTILGKRSGSD